VKDLIKIIFVWLAIIFCGGYLLTEKNSTRTQNEISYTKTQSNFFLGDFHKYNDFPEGKELILEYFDSEKNRQNNLSPKKVKKNEKIIGGIVSHHIPLAFPLVADFYDNIKSENPEVIFILGPDHFHRASFDAITTDLPFYTPFGFLETDKKVISALEEKSLIKIDNKAFAKEHSILSQVFFLKYFFPKAKIVPLIFGQNIDIKDAKIIAENLRSFEEKGIFIASVDFSHYLSLKDAKVLDENTKKKLENYYFEDLSMKECDSPISLQVMFFLAEELGNYNFKVLQIKNSADFSQITDRTTGYISAIFQK